MNHVVNGHICAGFDRHNSEVFAYYLAMVLNFRWISPSVIRKIHLHRDVVPFATKGLKNSMIKNGNVLKTILMFLYTFAVQIRKLKGLHI